MNSTAAGSVTFRLGRDTNGTIAGWSPVSLPANASRCQWALQEVMTRTYFDADLAATLLTTLGLQDAGATPEFAKILWHWSSPCLKTS